MNQYENILDSPTIEQFLFHKAPLTIWENDSLTDYSWKSMSTSMVESEV